MNTPESRRWEMHQRYWDRVKRRSIVVSVALHVLLFLLFFRSQPPLPEVPQAAAGERAGDPTAAAGGGMQMIAIREVQPPPTPPEIVEPIPVPVPEPRPEPIEHREPIAAPSTTQGQTAAAGDGQGQTTGPGTATGTGQGDGGTGDAGLYRVTAPSPRGMILPPSDRPSRVRGRSVTVYVFVNVRGAVVADSTRIDPSSGDNRFDQRLKQQAAEWRFNPATRGGQPVAEWFQYVMHFH